MSWREWLEKAKMDTEAIRARERRKNRHDWEMAGYFKGTWFDENAELLIEGLRLCAEAVEAVVEHLELQKICPFCLGSKDEGGHMPCCEVNNALKWLRGVGK